METFKDKVAIVGMGCVKPGELWDKDDRDIIVDAVYEALNDAGLERKDIQAAWVGNQRPGFDFLNTSMKLDYIPVSHVQNACASAGDTFRNACAWVAAGLYDIVLACGAAKMKDAGTTGIDMSGNGAIGAEGVISATGVPVNFALYAVRYMHHYGYTERQLKTALARLAVKNHRNGALNPKAYFQKEITMGQALNAPIIAWPLGLYDCCANIDGGAAAIITRPDIAKHIRSDYVLVKGIGMAVGGQEGRLQQQYKFVEFPENELAAKRAYEQAGIKDPFKELSHAELHDAFTVNELVDLEDLQLAPRGKAPEYIMAGVYDLEGQLPENTSGGLKCCGHPPPATGIKMMYECYKQMQGKAGPRQVKNPALSLAHNQGGLTGSFTTVVHIFGARD
ncbi:MAG: acetyl-CoA acetyltransferase [Chloroflexi bacterium]|nr:acetyl-CoA acetyltransferase [Chloroflexota bacterium]